jgi:Protein of unknown function (DUF3363)
MEGWSTQPRLRALLDHSGAIEDTRQSWKVAYPVTSGRIEALRPLPDGPWLFSRAVLDGAAAKALVDRAWKRAGHPTGPDPDQQSLFPSMGAMKRSCGTPTTPHIHVLVRGQADDGKDLVISRDYISQGFRKRASERVTMELGPRSELELRSALEKEIDAGRWTTLDRSLRNAADEGAGVADLRPGAPGEEPGLHRLLLGRAAKLERLGLAEQISSGLWELKPGIEPTLRDLSIRGDIIKTMHRAMTGAGREPDVSGFAAHQLRLRPVAAGGLERRAEARRARLWRVRRHSRNAKRLRCRSAVPIMDERRAAPAGRVRRVALGQTGARRTAISSGVVAKKEPCGGFLSSRRSVLVQSAPYFCLLRS